MSFRLMTCGAILALALGSSAQALEPSWAGRAVVSRAQRALIESTPIVQRSYRPLHVYGNTVRRAYYHDRLLPRPREFARGAGAWVRRR